MHNKRPVQYIDWVNVFNRSSGYLAHYILYNFNNGFPLINKNVYDTIRRLDRINKRIDLEHDVMDSSYLDVLLKAIDDHEED